MNIIFDFLFSQYKNYETYHIVLEIIAVMFGVLSVWYAKKENILVFPTGLVNTGIFFYLLFVWGLLGDMMINGYYFVMSIYGWYNWSQKEDSTHHIAISRTTNKEKMISVVLFIATVIFVILVYQYFDKFNTWTAYVDTFTTAIFFVAMWLMAKKKIENWVYWIIGNIITIPLYFYKGLTFSSFQYIIFLIIAIYGYKEWKQQLNNQEAS